MPRDTNGGITVGWWTLFKVGVTIKLKDLKKRFMFGPTNTEGTDIGKLLINNDNVFEEILLFRSFLQAL